MPNRHYNTFKKNLIPHHRIAHDVLRLKQSLQRSFQLLLDTLSSKNSLYQTEPHFLNKEIYQTFATVRQTFRINAMKEHLTNHACLKSGFWAPVIYIFFKSWNCLNWKLLSINVHAVSLFYFTEYFCNFNVTIAKISRDWSHLYMNLLNV